MHTRPILVALVLSLLVAACQPAPDADRARLSDAPPTSEPSPEREASGWPSAPPSSPLEAAHEAFLDGDHATMVDDLKAILADPDADPATRRNAIDLLEVAYEDTQGRLPAHTKLPDALDRLTFESIVKTEPGRLKHRVVVRGWATSPHRIEGMRLLHGPHNTVVLDQAQGLGAYASSADDDGFEFELEGPEVASPAPDGLYTLSMRIDGQQVSVWFIASGLTSSATPTLRVPAAGQALSTTQPVLAWDDFRSPEHKTFEPRARSVWIARLQSDAPGPAWTLWTSDAIQRAKVGHHPSGRGVDALEPGLYWIALTYSEGRTQGPIALKRVSRTASPFSVREDAR